MFERTLFKFYCNALLLSMGSTSIGCSRMEFEGYSASNASAASAGTEESSDEADTPESISGAFLVCGPADTADVPESAGDRLAIGCRAVIDDSYTLHPCSDWNTIRVTYEDGSSENIKPSLAIQHPFWQFFAAVQNNHKINRLSTTASCLGYTTGLAAQRFDYQLDPAKSVKTKNLQPALASAEAGTNIAQTSPAPPPQAHLIFVTRDPVAANIGYTGFDQACQTAATAAGLSKSGEKFWALISGVLRPDQAPRRLAGNPRLVNTRGVTISPEGHDIWLQGVQNAVAYDEYKKSLSSNGIVWTGAESDGRYSAAPFQDGTNRSCGVIPGSLVIPKAWSNRGSSYWGWVGNAKESGPAWFHTQGAQHPCNLTAHVYCISETPLPLP